MTRPNPDILTPDEREACLGVLRELLARVRARGGLSDRAAWSALLGDLIVDEFDFGMFGWKITEAREVLRTSGRGGEACIDYLDGNAYPMRARFRERGGKWRLSAFQGGCPVCLGDGANGGVACDFCDGTGFHACGGPIRTHRMTLGALESASWLGAGENAGYGALPIPSTRDLEITALLRAWSGLESSDRHAEAQAVGVEQCRTLRCYGERMASYAVRTGDKEHLRSSVLALGLGWGKGDERETLVSLCLPDDAARRLGVSAEVVFNEAAELLPETSAAGLRAFARRSGRDRSLKSMGYRDGADVDGFRYVREW